MFQSKIKDFQLLDVSDDDFLTIMDNCGKIRQDLKVPEGDFGTEIKTSIKEGKDIFCTVSSACGKEAVISTKKISGIMTPSIIDGEYLLHYTF